MKSWNDLSLLQKAIIGLALTIGAAFLPEIALLVNWGGMEIAFAMILASLSPFIHWLTTRLNQLRGTMLLAVNAFTQIASARPRVYILQSMFVGTAFVMTGSAFALTFMLPGMLFNSIWV